MDDIRPMNVERVMVDFWLSVCLCRRIEFLVI